MRSVAGFGIRCAVRCAFGSLCAEVDAPEPGPGEVQIDVEAITINFNDIDGIRSRYRTVPVEPPYIPGMEVLGRVRGAGNRGEALIGTRVCRDSHRCLRRIRGSSGCARCDDFRNARRYGHRDRSVGLHAVPCRLSRPVRACSRLGRRHSARPRCCWGCRVGRRTTRSPAALG